MKDSTKNPFNIAAFLFFIALFGWILVGAGTFDVVPPPVVGGDTTINIVASDFDWTVAGTDVWTTWTVFARSGVVAVPAGTGLVVPDSFTSLGSTAFLDFNSGNVAGRMNMLVLREEGATVTTGLYFDFDTTGSSKYWIRTNHYANYWRSDGQLRATTGTFGLGTTIIGGTRSTFNGTLTVDSRSTFTSPVDLVGMYGHEQTEDAPSTGVRLLATHAHWTSGTSTFLVMDDAQGTFTANGSAITFSNDGAIYFGADNKATSESIYWNGSIFVATATFRSDGEVVGATGLRSGSGIAIGGSFGPEADALEFFAALATEPANPAKNDWLLYGLSEATDDFGTSLAITFHHNSGTTVGIFEDGSIWTPGTLVLSAGTIRTSPVIVLGDYTVDEDFTVVTSSTVRIDITLPDASGSDGDTVYVYRWGSGAVDIERTGSDAIDGGTSTSIAAQYSGKRFQAVGTLNAWITLATP